MLKCLKLTFCWFQFVRFLCSLMQDFGTAHIFVWASPVYYFSILKQLLILHSWDCQLAGEILPVLYRQLSEHWKTTGQSQKKLRCLKIREDTRQPFLAVFHNPGIGWSYTRVFQHMGSRIYCYSESISAKCRELGFALENLMAKISLGTKLASIAWACILKG